MTKPKPIPQTDDSAYLVTDEVALLCRCSVSSVVRRVRDRGSDFPRPLQLVPRGTWLFHKHELEQYLNAKQLTPETIEHRAKPKPTITLTLTKDEHSALVALLRKLEAAAPS